MAGARATRVTIGDIAKKLRIHQSTVSRSLQDSSLISPGTKKRVKDAVKKMNYRPNAIARSLATSRTNFIGLIVPDIKNPFCAEIIEYFEEISKMRGFDLMLSITGGEIEKEENAVRNFTGRVDGMIINHHQSYTSSRLINELQKDEFPFVLLGWFKGTNASYVMADLSKGAYLVTRHLLELGHRSIVFMAAGNDNDALRMQGYRRALKESGVEYDSSMVVRSGEEIQGAEKALDEILEMKKRPTAIFAINDLLAIGILDAAEKRKIRIPEDFALAGFDNIKISAHARFSITTVDYPLKELAKISMDLLQEQMEGRSDGPEQIMIEPRLVVRRSSGGQV
jgi:LacI family transcriptional regulator